MLGMLVPFWFMSSDIEPAGRPLHDITTQQVVLYKTLMVYFRLLVFCVSVQNLKYNYTESY